TYVPALAKLLDEVVVNALDVRSRGGRLTRLDVTVDARRGVLSVGNDAASLPVVRHPDYGGVYVPELLFGSLLTGSNFDAPAAATAGAAGTAGAADARVTGGRHGYGAKLANILSTRFTVSTTDPRRGLAYEQTWGDNMRDRQPPTVVPLDDAAAVAHMAPPDAVAGGGAAAGGYTRVTFTPDVGRFAAEGGAPAAAAAAASAAATTPALDAPTVAVMVRRVWDAAAVLAGTDVAVTLNGVRLDVPSLAAYAARHRLPGTAAAAAADGADAVASTTVAGTTAGGWRLAVRAMTPGERAAGAPAAVSYVNGVATTRGGTHVAAVADALARRVADEVARASRRAAGGGGGGGGGGDVGLLALVGASAPSAAAVRRQLLLFVDAVVDRPAFESQSKELLTSRGVAAAAAVPRRLLDAVAAPRGAGGGTGIFEAVAAAAARRSRAAEAAAAGAGGGPRRGGGGGRGGGAGGGGSAAPALAVPKLDDALWAGGRRSAECTLLVTEGDSAKALAVAGLSVVGRSAYGAFPIRGKLLNVREVSLAKAVRNTEVAALRRILGLGTPGTDYTRPGARGSLRYGRLMLMMDQDSDGSHIKGLLLNLLDRFWPSLLRLDPPYVEAFVTPLVKAIPLRGGARRARGGGGGGGSDGGGRSFYSLDAFEAWRQSPEGG
ncbi:hypothetical protein BU14_2364s0001, partial [Porphyra umbilicalis]